MSESANRTLHEETFSKYDKNRDDLLDKVEFYNFQKTFYMIEDDYYIVQKWSDIKKSNNNFITRLEFLNSRSVHLKGLRGCGLN